MLFQDQAVLEKEQLLSYYKKNIKKKEESYIYQYHAQPVLHVKVKERVFIITLLVKKNLITR